MKPGDFNIGDHVFLNPESMFATGEMNNPLNQVGTIIAINPINNFCYDVRWASGMDNTYRKIDLLPATKLSKLLAGVDHVE